MIATSRLAEAQSNHVWCSPHVCSTVIAVILRTPAKRSQNSTYLATDTLLRPEYANRRPFGVGAHHHAGASPARRRKWAPSSPRPFAGRGRVRGVVIGRTGSKSGVVRFRQSGYSLSPSPGLSPQEAGRGEYPIIFERRAELEGDPYGRDEIVFDDRIWRHCHLIPGADDQVDRPGRAVLPDLEAPQYDARREQDLVEAGVLPIRPVLVVDLEFRPKILHEMILEGGVPEYRIAEDSPCSFRPCCPVNPAR